MSTLLITGATSGIGQATAMLAAEQGYNVIACGRNQAALEELERQANITALAFDATDKDATLAALDGVACDIAILNAGTCEYVDLPEFDPDMFARVFAINVQGVANVIAGLHPQLNEGNKLVFVDSLARLFPFPRSSAYGGSKAALNYMAKSLAVDYARFGIKVQTISPGFVKTPLTDKNDFDMPLAIEVEQAAQHILKGIQSNRQSIYFPTRLSLILRALNTLPQRWQHSISLKLRNPPKGTS
jgi:NAD(P)-dependent dehydrogenase (short-subunit alcohol dehydrogenase family)